MFRFDPEKYGHKGVVDEGRNASFRYVSGMGPTPQESALLTWGDRQIPLAYQTLIQVDVKTGKKYGQYAFVSFGDSWKVADVLGIGPYEFRNDEERSQARILAAEGLLAMLYKYVTGPWQSDGNRVLTEGREWRASDFGYWASADEMDAAQ